MIFNHSGSQALRWIKLVKKGTGQKWVNKAYLNATTETFERMRVNFTLFYLSGTKEGIGPYSPKIS